jgi:hypothetical protein
MNIAGGCCGGSAVDDASCPMDDEGFGLTRPYGSKG